MRRTAGMSEPALARRRLADAAATARAASELGAVLLRYPEAAVSLHLRGELGAGKTTFARGLLHALGHQGRVPSPTYTLVEPYVAAGREIWHLDLYRVGDGAELDYLGLDGFDSPGAILLVEWPERGEDYLPTNDLQILFQIKSQARDLTISPLTEMGRQLLDAWKRESERAADAGNP